jgi:hypothetical protein
MSQEETEACNAWKSVINAVVEQQKNPVHPPPRAYGCVTTTIPNDQIPICDPACHATAQAKKKAEVIHNLNHQQNNALTKAQKWSLLVRGKLKPKQGYATQSWTYTNPNINNYIFRSQYVLSCKKKS